MARKTFISYKYSEARNVRDKIIENMGDDASYYQGETSDSPDLTDLKTDSIKSVLRDMMFNTSVTIVIISPNMKQSNWIDWEISYTLKEISREGRTSKTNGILGVIMEIQGSTNWFVGNYTGADGCTFRRFRNDLLYDIINKNRFNEIPKRYSCEQCQTINGMTGNYLSFVDESTFLGNSDYYIENAFTKSENIDSYEIVKEN